MPRLVPDQNRHSLSQLPWRFFALVAPGILLLCLSLHRFDWADPRVPDSLVSLKGSQLAPAGVGSAAADEVKITSLLPSGPWRSARLYMVGAEEPIWSLRLTRGHQSHWLFNVHAGEERLVEFEPDPLGGDDAATPTLILATKAADAATLRQVRVRLSAEPDGKRPRNATGIIALMLTPLALACYLTAVRGRAPLNASLIGGAVAILITCLSAYEPMVLELVPLLNLGLAGATLLALVIRALFSAQAEERAALWQTAGWVGFAIVMMVGLLLRWEAFVDARSAPLLPDARGYVQIAREGSFYRTAQEHAPWVREPLFPAALRLAFLILPETATAARFFSMLLGLNFLALIYLVGRRLFGPLVALIAAGWAACAPYLARESVEVLRDEFLAALFLGLMLVALVVGEKKWWRAAAFGALGGALVLTRLSNLYLLLPLIGLEAVRRRWHPAEPLVVLALIIVPVLPHLSFNAEYSGGDHFFSSSVHSRYYLNRDMIGQPGYPATLAEWEQDPYAGEVISTRGFYSHYSLPQIVSRTLTGYAIIFTRFPHGELFHGWETVMLFGLAGAWGLWQRRREVWWVLVWMVWWLFPMAFITTIWLDTRLVMPAAALVLWVWALGVVMTVRWLWERGRAIREACRK